MSSNKSRLRRRKKRSLFRKFVYLFLLIFVAIAGYGTYIVVQGLQASEKTYDELDRGEQSALRDEEVRIGEDPFSVLLMGIEDYSTGGENGRTDTLILLTIDPANKTAKMVSIPRDTRVEIVGKDRKDKINHAHAFGGPDMTINSVENFLDIPIDYYVKINFEGFKDIINDLDGVKVDVPFDFWEYSDEDGEKIYFKEGSMKLKGEEALAYVRMRRFDSDFGRSDRQKQVIQAALQKVFTAKGLLKIDDISQHLGDNVSTNLRVSELLALQKEFKNVPDGAMETLEFEGEDSRINGVYYFEPYDSSVNEISSMLQQHINHDQTSEEN